MAAVSKSKSPVPACPACGGAVVPIVYGLPGPELFEASERGEVVLGGCMIIDDTPAFQCAVCGQSAPTGPSPQG